MPAFVYNGTIYHTRELSPVDVAERAHVIYAGRLIVVLARAVDARLTHIAINTPDGLLTARASPARRYIAVAIASSIIMVGAAAAVAYAAYIIDTYDGMLAMIISALVVCGAALTLWADVAIMRGLHKIHATEIA